MPPKKRKLPAQSTTLHRFFVNSPGNAAINEPDVIVISDSDDELDPPPKSRRRTQSSAASFGTPSLLVPKLKEPSRTFSLGSASLLEDPELASLASSSSFLSTSGIIDLSEDDPADVMFEDTVAWALDDDEIDTFPADDESDGLGMDLTFDSQADMPLCSKSLVDLSEEIALAHVNACLDGQQPNADPQPGSSRLSDTPEGAEASSSKRNNSKTPLRPVSELPIPPCPQPSSTRGTNAFSKLMSSHKETEAWKEATEAENSPMKGGRRKAPFFKILRGMPIAVDAFRYGKIPGVVAYFLSHAHSDHYTNLSSSWKHGPIYCSETTGNLIVHLLGVDRQWVHPLPIDQPVVIPGSGGVEVINIEANHCPGSSLFLFTGPQTCNAGDSTFHSRDVGSGKTFRYLHCGDFRASPQHALHPAIGGKRLDLVYLDTTYLSAKYCFPPQPEVISACAELAQRLVQRSENPTGTNTRTSGWMDGWVSSNYAKGNGKAVSSEVASKPLQRGRVLIVVGTYSIGKERIVKAIAKALNAKIFCDARKRGILQCQTDPELHSLLSNNPRTSQVHVVPLQLINAERMVEYLDKLSGEFDRVVAFRPTGWTYSPPKGVDLFPAIPLVLSRAQTTKAFNANSLKPSRGSTSRVTLYGVPYSEHSSFYELTAFALSVDWVKMIATVNVGSAASRGKMEKWFEKWAAERKARMRNARGVQKGIVEPRAADYW
ncbi:DRMBL-domain-containing protein [Auriculariales sp. MPI-PUGE-AT-0066]|nr:DRMBL-domain-containing protein [Auriculariales sp. MPI-PUGE-AT-0066]